ncbi:hypothetical protein [Hymenobacter algoricola]|uniref:Outer membrane protein beta-barrel domain-containing protein n=1 Tax=Hymenobacter algoricola TaxID=486267 RepID=A0ABP7MEZ4_9BACT
MKKTTLPTLLLAGLAFTAQAQDQPHKFEVGLEVLNFSPYVPTFYSYQDTRTFAKAQWVSGAIFRSNFGRFGLRSGVGYNAETDNTDNTNCADCLIGQTERKELRLTLGGQYAPLKKAQWLYVFSDFYYRRFTSEANFSGGLCGCINSDVDIKSNGGGNNTGLGIKIKTFRHFYLNPEASYEVLRAWNTQTTTDRNTDHATQFTSRTNGQGPALRLNAIYAF